MAVVAILLGADLAAQPVQDKPNFTGQWTRADRVETGAGSGTGRGGGRGGAATSLCGQTCVIKHDATELVVERLDAAGAVTTKYRLDGRDSRVSPDVTAKASWEGGRIVIASRHSRDPGVTRTLTLSMTDGNLVVEGSTDTGQGVQPGLTLTYRPGGPPPDAAGRITRPTLVHDEKPRYSSEAQRAKIQGIVEVEAVVLENGTVGEVRIHKSLDTVFGLDAQALAAAKKWRFRPALSNGKPVPFKVIIQLEFRLGRSTMDTTP